MRYPKLGTFAEGLEYDGSVTHLDLVATILELCSIDSDSSYEHDGMSFLPDLQRVIGQWTSNSDYTHYPSSASWSGAGRCVFAEYEFDRSVKCGCFKYVAETRGRKKRKAGNGKEERMNVFC